MPWPCSLCSCSYTKLFAIRTYFTQVSLDRVELIFYSCTCGHAWHKTSRENLEALWSLRGETGMRKIFVRAAPGAEDIRWSAPDGAMPSGSMSARTAPAYPLISCRASTSMRPADARSRSPVPPRQRPPAPAETPRRPRSFASRISVPQPKCGPESGLTITGPHRISTELKTKFRKGGNDDGDNTEYRARARCSRAHLTAREPQRQAARGPDTRDNQDGAGEYSTLRRNGSRGSYGHGCPEPNGTAQHSAAFHRDSGTGTGTRHGDPAEGS